MQNDNYQSGKTGDKVWRLFVALNLPEPVVVALIQAQDRLRQVFPSGGASFPRRDNLHLTLRFLGNVEVNQVEALCQSVAAQTARLPALELTCRGLGCFPHVRAPRVVWAGVVEATGGSRLTTLQEKVCGAVAAFAEKPAEKRFAGHVTLARVKRARPEELRRCGALINEAGERPFGSWKASSIELIRSELTPQGSLYTTICSFALGL